MSERFEAAGYDNEAVRAYMEIGPTEFVGDIDLVQLKQQLNQCESQPLEPAEQLMLGWMYTEHAVGLGLGRAAFLAGRKHLSGRQAVVVRAMDSDFLNARATFQAVIDNPSADPLVKAQAYSARGSLPFWRFVIDSKVMAGKMKRVEPMHKLGVDLHYAASELIPALEAGSVPEEALRYCQAMGIKLLIMDQTSGQDLAIIDAPPRFSRLQTDTAGWDGLLMDLRTAGFERLRVGKSGEGYTNISPRPQEPIDPPDPQRLLLLRTLIDLGRGKPIDSRVRPMVSISARSVYDFTRSISNNKLMREAISKAGKIFETNVSLLFRAVGEDPDVVPQVPELEPVVMAPIDVRSVDPDKLLQWYGHNPVCRLFTLNEANDLANLAHRFEATDIYRHLNPNGTVTYCRLLLEIAGAVANREPENASFYIEKAQEILIGMQQSLSGADSIYGYEALVELARIDMMRLVLAGSVEAGEVESFQGELTEQLSEALNVNKRTHDRELKTKLRNLVPLLLGSAFIMRYVSEPTCLAIPSLPRHRGTDQAPGWNVTVWPQTSEGLAINNIRRLRIDAAAKQMMRQGNVVIVPARIPDIKVGPQEIQKHLVAAYREEPHSSRALTKWAPAIGEFFTQALCIFDPAAQT